MVNASRRSLWSVAGLALACLAFLVIASILKPRMASSRRVLFDPDGPSIEDPSHAAWARAGEGTTAWMLKHKLPHDQDSPAAHDSVWQHAARKQAARHYDPDGPSPRDLPPSAWESAGKGTTAWMLNNQGPPVASRPVGKKGRLTSLFDLDGPSIEDPSHAAWARAGKGTTAWMLKHKLPQHEDHPVAEGHVRNMPWQHAVRKPAARHYDPDGPSPSDLPPSAWERAGKGTTGLFPPAGLPFPSPVVVAAPLAFAVCFCLRAPPTVSLVPDRVIFMLGQFVLE